jgi:ribosomal protein S18 acetylase RimI-like enzyme
VEIRRLAPGDEAAVDAAAALFDAAPEPAATRRFLADPGHHLLIAYEGDAPAGFVSGVELTHPDKGTEMFLYELGVEERFRARGIGRALVAALRDLARERGCYGMWVLTDEDNAAARAAYAAAGGTTPSPQLMLSWEFDRAADAG